MSKITVVTCVWKRPLVLELFLKNWTTLNPKPEIIVMGSPEDECEQLAKEYGFHYFTTENQPLGKKWNDAMEAARNHAPAGYYLIVGSDDLMSQAMWTYYNQFTGDILGLLDSWFYNLQSDQVMYWPGFAPGHHRIKNGPEPIGSCKLISHAVLSQCAFRPFDDKLNRALDFEVTRSILKGGAQPTYVKCSDTGGITVDLKSGHNLNAWKLWQGASYKTRHELKTVAPELWDIIKEYDTVKQSVSA